MEPIYGILWNKLSGMGGSTFGLFKFERDLRIPPIIHIIKFKLESDLIIYDDQD